MRLVFLTLLLVLSAPLMAQKIGTCFDPGGYRFQDASIERSFQTGNSYFAAQQYAAAIRYLQPAAEAGHARAEELMGQAYMFGYAVPQSPGIAYMYFNRAAEQGHRGAIADMGFYWSQVEQNLPLADKYFLAAARCGSVTAQAELAMNFEFGRGVPPDRREAIYWMRQAAPHWDAAAIIVQWLENPNTPRFQNADELGRYISMKTRRNIQFPKPFSGIPFTQPCSIMPVGSRCLAYGGNAVTKEGH